MFRRTMRAACCAALLAAGLLPAQAPSRPAAVVNGEPISVEQLDAELRQSPMALHQPEAQRRLRRMEALGLLIDNALMRQILDRDPGPVSPDALSRRLADLVAGLHKDNQKTLAEHCQETGQTPEQLKAGVACSMQWATFAASRLTEEALQKYYRENKPFFDKARVRASHIVLRVPSSAGDPERARVRARLEDMRKHLMTDPGADFAAMARRHSQDGHADKGGDLGFFPRKWAFDEAFSRAAFALPVGGLSEVIDTEFGCHLIKVTGRDEGTPSSYEACKEAVKAFCGEELRQDVLARERARAAQAGSIKINLP